MKSLIHPTANEFNFDRWAIAGPIDKSFKALGLQDKNLRLVTRKDWKYPSVAGDAKKMLRTLATGLFFTDRNDFSAPEQKSELRHVQNWFNSICESSDRIVRRDKINEYKARLLGAWINFNYGWFGMAFTCEGLNQNLRDAILEFWDGIGAWKHLK